MRSIALALLLLLLPSTSSIAQKTEAELRTRLMDKPLYLRGLWAEDKLDFDAAGRVLNQGSGNVAQVSFTLAGVAIDTVKLKRDGLTLEGQRVGLAFFQNGPQRVGLLVSNGSGASMAQKMTIHIQPPPDGDYTAALDAIFSGNLADFVPQMPDFWQSYAHRYILSDDSSTPASAAPRTRVQPIAGLSAPVLLNRVHAPFTEAARALHYYGTALLNFQVEPDGTTSHIRIVRPVGLGLDESAVAAVSQYKFRPAMKNGTPIRSEINIDVNFQAF